MCNEIRDTNFIGGNCSFGTVYRKRCLFLINRRFIMKILQEMRISFKEKKFELLFNFIAIISGVLIAFKLEDCAKKRAMNDGTITRIGIMYLESQYNITEANEIFKTYSDTNSISVSVDRLDKSAASLVLQNENVFNVLTTLQVSLIQSYIDALNTVNRMNETYFEHLDAVGYRTTDNGRLIRTKLRENTASFLATSYVFECEFKKFFDKKGNELREIEKFEATIKKAKQKILDGKLKLGK